MPLRPGRTARSSSKSSKRADPSAAARPDPAWVAVGDVVAAHGLRGLLRVRPYQPPTSSLSPEHVVRLDGSAGRRDVVVRSAAVHGRGHMLVAVSGVDDRSAAEDLVGSTVFVRAADLAPLAPDEFYWHEVVGFRVETLDGRLLGSIVETFATGAHDVWVVRGDREHLIPVVDEVVRLLDRDDRRAVIDPPAGLID